MNAIVNLKPERVWYYFNEICKIPRPSKKEEKIIQWLLDFGKKHNLETIKDEVGNVLILKPATKGKEKSKTVVLQSHIDMVCEKNADTTHDFEKDSIIPMIDGEWIKAKGTTLGADDGIGMAAQLAILESTNLVHGPIECLFTVDEETGLTGAFALKEKFLKGNILLNLDSEDEGQLFIGCAGGIDTTVTLPFHKENIPKQHIGFKVSVIGLKGGHSGDDINKGRGNAVKIINRFLWNATEKFKIRIATINGGNLRNAIARESFAEIVVSEQYKIDLIQYASQFGETVKNELKSNEPELSFSIEPISISSMIIDEDTQKRVLNALYIFPHGVIAMSADMPGLVETSTNLASVKTRENEIIIQTSQRSSIHSSKIDIATMVEIVFKSVGAKATHGDGYPGWKPNINSEILNITRNIYSKLFKTEPKVLAIHAGLECGVIGEKYKGMDMISFGPTLRGVHSPDERIHIGSVEKFWKLLVEILKEV